MRRGISRKDAKKGKALAKQTPRVRENSSLLHVVMFFEARFDDHLRCSSLSLSCATSFARSNSLFLNASALCSASYTRCWFLIVAVCLPTISVRGFRAEHKKLEVLGCIQKMTLLHANKRAVGAARVRDLTMFCGRETAKQNHKKTAACKFLRAQWSALSVKRTSRNITR